MACSKFHLCFIQKTMSDCPSTCPYVGQIAKLESENGHITPVIASISSKLDQVIIGLGRVELLEVKHNNHAEALTRAFTRIENIEKQVAETSRVLADTLSQIKGMTRVAVVLWTVMGGFVGFIITKVG